MKFKTSINCGGCIATVTPILNNIPEIKHWEVDTVNPDKILTISAEEGFRPEVIVQQLTKVGHKAEWVA